MVFKRLVFLTVMSFLLIGGCSPDLTDGFIRDLDNDNPTTRRLAGSRLMTMRKNPYTQRKLVGLLKSDKERLVFLAVQILGSYPDTTLIQPIAGQLENPNSATREAAARSLGSIGHENALPYLVKALDDSVSGVRHAAVTSIGYLYYPPATEFIFKMFRDPVDSVRAASVNALYMYRNHKEANIRAADFAVPLRDKSDLVRFVTVQALGWSSPGGYPDSTVAGEFLIEALRDRNKYVRIEAINSLGKNCYQPAVSYLKKMYDMATLDEEYRITEAIKTITGEEYPPLEDVK